MTNVSIDWLVVLSGLRRPHKQQLFLRFSAARSVAKHRWCYTVSTPVGGAVSTSQVKAVHVLWSRNAEKFLTLSRR